MTRAAELESSRTVEYVAHIVTLDWWTWLVTVELLGLAALPLTAFLFRAFPDRGYALSKPLGLALVSFTNWWLGSTAGWANYPLLLWSLAVLFAVAGISLYTFGIAERPRVDGRLARTIALEEGLFLLAFVTWSLVRALRPDIFSSEKPMDFMLLRASGAAHTFPPLDPWLSGYTVNYYYLGYATFGMIGTMAGVDPRFGFNLANVTIFALGCTASFSLVYALTKRASWGLAGIFCVMLAGNLDTIPQIGRQLASGGLNAGGLDLWCSTRIVDGGCAASNAISEFPIFSLLWNDLHPHVMDIPFALLAIGVGIHVLYEPPALMHRAARCTWLALASLAIAMPIGVNSWDFPTYALFFMLATGLANRRSGTASRWPSLQVLAVVPAALLLNTPYFLTVHDYSESLRFHATSTALGDALTVMGGSLVPVAIFVCWRPASSTIRWLRRHKPDSHRLLSARWTAKSVGLYAILVAFLLLEWYWGARTDLLYAVLLALAANALLRFKSAQPAVHAELLLALVGIGMLLAPDLVYLGSTTVVTAGYRMNTIFKLYFQAWLLLGLAAPAAIRSIAGALASRRSRWPRRAWYATAALVASALAFYPIEGAFSQGRTMAVGNPGLDGLAYVQDMSPDLYATVTWLLSHTKPSDVVVEAVGIAHGDYWSPANGSKPNPNTGYLGDDPNVISALTARPTLLGWPSHESLWRGAVVDGSHTVPFIQLAIERVDALRTLYETSDISAATAVLRKYHVAYVVLGAFEQLAYNPTRSGASLRSLSPLLTPVLRLRTETLYKVRCPPICSS